MEWASSRIEVEEFVLRCAAQCSDARALESDYDGWAVGSMKLRRLRWSLSSCTMALLEGGRQWASWFVGRGADEGEAELML